MLAYVRDPRWSHDRSGYGHVARLRSVEHPGLNALWTAVTGAVTTPYVPIYKHTGGQPAAVDDTAAVDDVRFTGNPAVPRRRGSSPRHARSAGRAWFDASSVRYTPDFGYRGQDSFQFSARDKTIAFPRTPRSVTATLGVGVAPLAVHRVAEDAGAESTLAQPRRAPDVPDALPERNGFALSKPQVFAHHDDLVVRTVSWRAGVVTAAVVIAGQVLDSCKATVPAGVPYTCLIPGANTLPDEAVVTTALRASKVLLATHSAAVP